MRQASGAQRPVKKKKKNDQGNAEAMLAQELLMFRTCFGNAA